jgi:exopolysaccharide biosynthesis polyprenyl glycosylphosphotransferase
MLAANNPGLLRIHSTLVGAEACLLWVCLSKSGLIRFSTQLSSSLYLMVIIAGVIVAHSRLSRRMAALPEGSIATAIQVSWRQLAYIAAALFSTIVLLKDTGISRVFISFYLLYLFAALLVVNRLQAKFLQKLITSAKDAEPTLLVSGSDYFPQFSHWLSQLDQRGYRLVGRLAYAGQIANAPQVPDLGSVENLPDVLALTGARQVILLNQPHSPHDTNKIVAACVAAGCRLWIHNNFADQLEYPLVRHQQYGHNYLALLEEPLEDPVNRLFKRLFDVVVASIAIVMFLPPIALCTAIAQQLQSPGTLLFKQYRTGHNHKRFKIYKFRTMHHCPPSEEARQVTGKDARIFSFGQLLRRTSLDEMPQFINVLKGEMSVVGPRPHLVQHDDEFAKVLSHYRMRFFAKPGITGLAQTNGYRGDTLTLEKIERRVHFDLMYIRQWSFWTDFWIVLRTCRQVILPVAGAR